MIKIECLNCHNVISIDDEVYLTKWKCCPCCSNALWEETTPESLNTFGKILFMAVKRGKDQGCKNPKLIKGILQDETPKELDKELKIFLRMFTNQHLDALIEAFDLDSDNALRVLNKIKNSMIYEEAFAKNWVDQMIENCMEAIRLYHGESHYVKKNYIILDQQNNDAKMETATDAAVTKEPSLMVNNDITDVDTDDVTDDETINEHACLKADKSIGSGVTFKAAVFSAAAFIVLFLFAIGYSLIKKTANEASDVRWSDSGVSQNESDAYAAVEDIEKIEKEEKENNIPTNEQENEINTTEDEPSDYLEAVITGSNTVRIRTSASVQTNNNIITTLANGTKVTIVGETTGTDGKLWYLIKFYFDSKEVSGYVRHDYLTLTDPEKYAEYRTPDKQEETEANTTEDESSDYLEAIISGGNTVRIRSSASVQTSNNIIASLANGTRVTVIGETTGADEKLWYLIKFYSDSKEEVIGYVRNDFLTITAP